MSTECKPSGPSASNLLLFGICLAAAMLLCHGLVAMEKAQDQSIISFMIDTLTQNFAWEGLSFLILIAATLLTGKLSLRVLPWLVGTSAVAFVLLRVLLHILHPELDPLRTAMSLYGLTEHGYLLLVTALLMSVMFPAAVLYLTSKSRSPKIKQVTHALVGVLSGTLIVAGSFIADPGQNMASLAAELSVSGMLHKVAGSIGFLLILLLPFLLLMQFDRRLGASRKWLLSLAVLFPILIASAVLFPEYQGLVQRVFLLAYLSWLTLACFLLRGATRWTSDS